VQQLFDQRDHIEERRRQREAEEASLARNRRLDEIAARKDQLWRQVETAINLKNQTGYREAVDKLGDLREVAERDGERAAFDARVQKLREAHRTKTAFLNRLKQAKLVD